MKILLINPNYHPESPTYKISPVPPLGLMSIASLLEKEGFEVRIIDAFLLKLSEGELSKEIIEYNPEIVGITSDSINFMESLRVARIVKTISNAFVVMGGCHATIRANQVIKHPEIDIVVIGEGEYTLLEIAQRIKDQQSLYGCEGCYLNYQGIIIKNPPRSRINNLDELPFPARHLVPFEKYPRVYLFGESGILRYPIDRINTSRGCPYNCSFCSSRIIWGAKYRTRNPKLVVDEIEHLITTYGTKSIYFREDNFTVNRKRVVGICEELKARNIDIDWVCSSRVNLVNKTLLSKMHDAGCKAIWYGMESGSETTLNKLNKEITLQDIKTAVSLTKEVGLAVGGSFMIGVPEETMKDINLTINLIKELKLTRTTIFPFMAIPDSELYFEVKKKGFYNSSFGDLLYVRTAEFNKKHLEKIIANLRKDLVFSYQIDNLKSNFLKYGIKYGLQTLTHPSKLKSFLKHLI